MNTFTIPDIIHGRTSSTRLGTVALILVVALRSIFFTGGIYALDSLIPLGSPPFILACAAIIGVLAGTRTAFSSLTGKGFFVGLTLLVIAIFLAIQGTFFLPRTATDEIFTYYVLSQHAYFCIAAFTIATILTWYFWRFRNSVTLELAALITGGILLFAGHRNFRFDAPKLINSLAWELNLEPLSVLVLIGVLILSGVFLYAFFSTVPARPVADSQPPPALSHSRPALLRGALLAALFGTVIYFIVQAIYAHYHAIQLTRVANGVGSERSPGMSPLGFHSALGSTNQPAGLVRLENDYRENPFTPMLYLRENALSEFNGHEMVIADRIYDRDVTGTTPEEPFHAEPDTRLSQRIQIGLAAYLLADHNNAFAIDYPLSITPLKNPNPQRFKGAFKALSLAPAFDPKTLVDAQVGDPDWSEETRMHYLKAHEDVRYRDMAIQLTLGSDSLAGKARAITDYLSQTSVYTLTPNHTVKPGEDPVAPFLFGDKRGYCVHFAHATVYMLRALGIPARIGTGYLTDLSQAKDGHILLRMSDRHAWAEVYIRGMGWIPFDTKPENVESAADTQVDMKLLEELMSMIGPDETILPKDIAKSEQNVEPAVEEPFIRMEQLLGGALLLIALLYLLKLFIRASWILPASPEHQARRMYRALASFYFDLGFFREYGETRAEFERRISHTVGYHALTPTPYITRVTFGEGTISPDVMTRLRDTRKEEVARISAIPIFWRILAAINPSSAVAFLTRTRW